MDCDHARQWLAFARPAELDAAELARIDEHLARRVFGSENPIGKRFRRYLPGLPQQDPWAQIVGVVGHILNDNLEQDPRRL